ncbi:unnamed protein product [Notodromas monacha]|uniref:Uncharacterized protein n=1 Tax=Notodromas monacha TaxID=399045 RepID=A0A7R9BJP0_9CRUS|nr:unnamed protein product [Notodromas monacha]CAG0916466.1 unnamed protein product [Notodromas monacha]
MMTISVETELPFYVSDYALKYARILERVLRCLELASSQIGSVSNFGVFGLLLTERCLERLPGKKVPRILLNVFLVGIWSKVMVLFWKPEKEPRKERVVHAKYYRKPECSINGVGTKNTSFVIDLLAEPGRPNYCGINFNNRVGFCPGLLFRGYNPEEWLTDPPWLRLRAGAGKNSLLKN